ncbi:unnamed protein product [Rotaria socialis]|uniref:Integrase catalytic domain-containing protein n=1 Tax=Rotaria socialis TaxID=392032 RepID=A0A821H3G9_9BILA|nr:unnamed protein product [Rotaria socialis]CAF4677002.1 unnamed protein product [Rotaria socialis]
MNWPATERECYAIIYAIEKWHKYLDGRSFIIETDHKPLLPFNLKQQLNSKRKHNIVADYLSRSPVDNGMNDEDDYTPTTSRSTQTDNFTTTHVVASVTTRAQTRQQKRSDDRQVDHSCVVELPQSHIMDVSNDHNVIVPFTWEQLKQLQHQDEQAKHMISHVKDFNDYFLEDNMLMKKSSPRIPFVPKGRIRSDIIKIYHDTPANGAHFSRNKTTQKVRQRSFWPNMIDDIRNYVKSCLPCLQNNHLRQKPPEGVWQLLTMDFHGPITPTTKDGNKYIIALTDVLSKFVITKAVRDCTASTAARFVTEEVILKYGTLKCILTDNGTHFTATMMTELLKKNSCYTFIFNTLPSDD